MNLSTIFMPSSYPGLIDRRGSIERSYLWQRKYKGVAIRISLRTKDYKQALHRYTQLSSTFVQLKQLNLSIDTIKASLSSVRDKLVDCHFLASLSQTQAHNIKDTSAQNVTPLLSKVIGEWVVEMDRDWAKSTKRLNTDRADHFLSWMKDIPIGVVTKRDISAYKQHLDKAYKSVRTRQNTLITVSSIFNFALSKREYIQRNPVNGMLYKNVETVNKKESITKDEHHKALSSVKDDELKWLLLILWYTGVRIGEAVQIRKSDYIVIDGIHCISINKDDGKTLKTSASIRDIPIHQDLIDLGILDIKPVFHWTTAGSAADRVRLAFKTVGLKRTSHCYRYSVSDRLREIEGIPDHVRYSILGHAHKTMTDRVYRAKQPISLMKKAIDCI